MKRLAMCALAAPLALLTVDACVADTMSVTAGAARVADLGVEELLDLMNERLALAPDVARYKWNTQGAIEDAERERQIIAGLAQQASRLGVSRAWAEGFFRAQIEASKAAQRALFERWRREGAGKFADVPDLRTQTRPKLDALTPRLLQALSRAWPVLRDPARRAEIASLVGQRLDGAGHDGRVAEIAGAPLVQVSGL